VLLVVGRKGVETRHFRYVASARATSSTRRLLRSRMKPPRDTKREQLTCDKVALVPWRNLQLDIDRLI